MLVFRAFFQAIDLESAYLAAFAFCHFGAIGGGNPVSAGQPARRDSISGARSNSGNSPRVVRILARNAAVLAASSVPLASETTAYSSAPFALANPRPTSSPTKFAALACGSPHSPAAEATRCRRSRRGPHEANLFNLLAKYAEVLTESWATKRLKSVNRVDRKT